MGSLPVTVIIPVKNEERNLPGCLRRLKRFEKILVVDSSSSDRTGEIAINHGAELVQFCWTGTYPKKRNWMLLNYKFTTDWVLFLDADEFVNEEFCNELATALCNTENVGYWLNYTNYFLGCELRHGVPQRKLALIRVGAGLYERIDEHRWSSLDMEVHEHPVLDGSTGEIIQRIDHRDFRPLDNFLLRHVDYAKWEASRHQALHAAGLEQAAHLTKRQRFKYRHLARWWYPWFYFVFAYVARRGFLDGRSGFLYAFYKLWYFETVRTLICNHHPTNGGSAHERPSKPDRLAGPCRAPNADN